MKNWTGTGHSERGAAPRHPLRRGALGAPAGGVLSDHADVQVGDLARSASVG